MPALMAKRSSSGLCAIRRELHRRRKLPAAPAPAPKGGIVKKSSAQQSSVSASIHKQSSPDEPAGPATKKPSSASILQHAPVAVAAKKQQLAVAAKGTSAATKEVACVPLGQVAPTRRSASIRPVSSGADTITKLSATTGAECIKNMPTAATRSRSSSIWVKKGMTVKVRTRAGILPTGHCLVLWLRARVVSNAADDDGCLEVMYNGNFPRDDPLRTVRVAMDDVRSMPDIAES